MLGASFCSVAIVLSFVAYFYIFHILGCSTYDINLPEGFGMHISFDLDRDSHYLKVNREGELTIRTNESGLYTTEFELSDFLGGEIVNDGIMFIEIDRGLPFREYHKLHEALIKEGVEVYFLSLQQSSGGAVLPVALNEATTEWVAVIDLDGDGSVYWSDSEKSEPNEVNSLHEITAISSKHAHRNGFVEIYVDPECDYQKFINLLDHLLLGDAQITSINILTSQR